MPSQRSFHHFSLLFTALTALIVLLSAKFTWPDGDDGRYTVWAISLAQGQGITNIHLPDPTPEVIVPPGLSLALAPMVAIFGADNLKAVMTFSAILLIALAWIYAWWLIKVDGMGDQRAEDRGRRTKLRGQGSEVRGHKSGDGKQRAEHRRSLPSSVFSLQSTVFSLWPTVILALWGVFTISTAWRVHTEILYMLLSFAAFACWPEKSARSWKAILPGLLAGAAFMTRTVGLALLPAGILALLVRREWTKALLFAAGFIAINLPLLIRAYAATGSPLPYTRYAGGDEAGLIDKLHSLFIFASHYLFYGLPDLMFYRLFSVDGLLAKLGLSMAIAPLAGIIGLLIAIGFLSRIFKFGFTDLYFGAYFVIISSFNQADYAARGEFLFQDRYVIPVIPLAAIYLTRALTLLAGMKWKPVSFVARFALPLLALYVAVTAIGAGISRFKAESAFRGISPMNPIRYYDSPNENNRAWGSYFASAHWLKSNAPPGAVIFCRKPHEMFIASGHTSDRYLEHGTGTNLFAAITQHRQTGAYLIEDAFIPETAFGRERIAIIEPLLKDHAKAFELVHETQSPTTRIWKAR